MLNWKKIAKYCPEEVTNNLRAYTREEIAKLLSEAGLRSLPYFADVIYWNKGRSYQRFEDKASKVAAQ
jgi:hypothetical protein